ncbi:MAG: type VI secretion system protein TssA [Rhodothermales bacterium]
MADDIEAPETEAPETDASAAEEPEAEAAEPEPEAAEPEPEEPALSPFLQAVLDPISPSNPVGDDVKYEDSFQQLKAEVDKVQSAGAEADFDRIVELGRKVVTTLSKDLTAASYLGFGLLRTQGLGGLDESASVVRILCETYWDDLYPPTRRMVARKNALQLLIDKSYEWLEPYKPKKGDGPALDRALAAYKSIQAIAAEQMGEDAPVLSRVTKMIETKLRAVPKDAPPPPPPSASGGEKAGGSASSSTSSAGGGDAGPAELRSPQQAATVVLNAVTFLRQHNKTDATPLRLARALRWGALVAAPPAENGKTLIPPFVEQRKTYLAGLLSRAEYLELAEEAETSFYEQPFWLDLQRYLVTAFDALGAPFAAARDGVIDDVAGLIRRFPNVSTLTFADGTPFADGATQEWIETRVRPALGGGDSGGASSGAGGSEALEEAYAEARSHLGKGDLAAAIAALGDASDASGRDRFRRRLYLAALCARGGRPAVARPLLEGLEAEIAAHRLDAWEPALAVEVWTALHGCYVALERSASPDQKPTFIQAAARVFERVCATEPGRGLALLGS